MFEEIRKGLLDSYKHKPLEGVSCIACGRAGASFALHVIEFYHADSQVTPGYLVPMSRSRGTTCGSVPLCNVCCPACNTCSLPIVTPWTKKVMNALKVRHQGITFVIGNGFCTHVHFLSDLKSMFRSANLVGLSKPSRAGKSSKRDDYELKNEGLAIYFSARPNDPVWGPVTPRNAEVVQHGFLEIWRRAELEKYQNTNSIPSEVVDTICDIANEVGEKNDLNPIFIILIAHQYVDADPMMRQMYRTRWVASMVDREQGRRSKRATCNRSAFLGIE